MCLGTLTSIVKVETFCIMRISILPLLGLLPTLALASPLHHASCIPPRSTSNSSNTYDYIVTGSGPGGGTIATNLALAGHSVLLIEAGSDASSDIRTQILALNDFSAPSVAWHFFVKHDDDEERLKRYNLLVWKLGNGECEFNPQCRALMSSLLIKLVDWVGKDPSVEGHVGAQRLGIFYPRGVSNEA
jgi:choline dehydrogenase